MLKIWNISAGFMDYSNKLLFFSEIKSENFLIKKKFIKHNLKYFQVKFVLYLFFGFCSEKGNYGPVLVILNFILFRIKILFYNKVYIRKYLIILYIIKKIYSRFIY